MPIKLIALPYPEEALAPVISAATLQTHHGKHHKAYVDKTNQAAEALGLPDAPLEDVIAAARLKGDKGAVDNSSQTWNHGFYWNSLTPGGSQPDTALAAAIDRDFGSLEALCAELADRGAKHFASGWVWLTADRDRLVIEETHDGDTVVGGERRPLLTIDVWEHAYYIDYRNERPRHLAAVTSGLLAWDFASRNYAQAEAWRYPG